MFFNLTNCLMLSALLFSIGMYGLLARKNILIMLISIELMLNAANLTIMAFARFQGDSGAVFSELYSWGNTSHTFVLLIMAVAAAEAAVGLAILIALFKHKKSADADRLNIMRG